MTNKYNSATKQLQHQMEANAELKRENDRLKFSRKESSAVEEVSKIQPDTSQLISAVASGASIASSTPAVSTPTNVIPVSIRMDACATIDDRASSNSNSQSTRFSSTVIAEVPVFCERNHLNLPST